jgi:hypothetical protein
VSPRPQNRVVRVFAGGLQNLLRKAQRELDCSHASVALFIFYPDQAVHDWQHALPSSPIPENGLVSSMMMCIRLALGRSA